MDLIGVEKLVFGVEDLENCKKFWRDFGLRVLDDTPERGLFECASKAKVEVRKLDDPALPPAVVDGSTARETVWGAKDQATVDRVAAELSRDRDVRVDAEGTIHALDPEGYGIAFAVTERIPLEPTGAKYNTPWQADRLDQPAIFYENAWPQHLAHVVFHISDLEGTPAFYMDRLGFKLTDSYTDRGSFIRAGAAIDHHNLFMIYLPGKMGFHHCAFEVRDIHEVFGAGLRMNELGWKTHLGPGRHNVTSAYYWYFRNPCGGAAEYGFDTDRVTDAWVPRTIEPTDGAFAEWSLEEGLGRFAGLQRGVEQADG
jgi:catechol 2,3-dioxygenase-like lactoylglutathione lyase family enzyme